MSALIESVRFVHGVRTRHQSPCIVRASSLPHSSITHKVADRIRVRAYAHTRSRLVDPSIPMANYSLLPSSSDHRSSPGATIHLMHPVRPGCMATQASNRLHRGYSRRSAIDHVGQRARNPPPIHFYLIQLHGFLNWPYRKKLETYTDVHIHHAFGSLEEFMVPAISSQRECGIRGPPPHVNAKARLVSTLKRVMDFDNQQTHTRPYIFPRVPANFSGTRNVIWDGRNLLVRVFLALGKL